LNPIGDLADPINFIVTRTPVGECQKLANEFVEELGLSLEEFRPQSFGSGKWLSPVEASGGIDRRAIHEIAPSSGGVEVLQAEPDRIQLFMATDAAGIGAMRFELLPQGVAGFPGGGRENSGIG
jgi:hypothetical protein